MPEIQNIDELVGSLAYLYIRHGDNMEYVEHIINTQPMIQELLNQLSPEERLAKIAEAKAKSFSTCQHCATQKPKKQFKKDGVCVQCYNNLYKSCRHCGGTVLTTEAKKFPDGVEYYCQACFTSQGRACVSCGVTHHKDSTRSILRQTVSSLEERICNTCIRTNREYVLCSNCGWAMNSSLLDDEDRHACANRFIISRVVEGKKERIKSNLMYGLELEYNSHAFKDGRRDTYQMHMPKIWQVGTDGSVRDGYEFRSCRLVGDTLIDYWPKFFSVIKGDLVTKECGFHVHIDGSGIIDKPKVLLALMILGFKYDKWLFSMQPPSRRGGRYCRYLPISEEELRYLIGKSPASSYKDVMNYWYGKHQRGYGNHESRYTGFNFHALHQHGTIEFRHHSGTKNINKIVPWIKLCQAFVDTAIARQNDLNSLMDLNPGMESMITTLNLDKETANYVKFRVNEHGVIKDYNPSEYFNTRVYDNVTPVVKKISMTEIEEARQSLLKLEADQNLSTVE